MSSKATNMDDAEAVTPISRREWLHMRAYWRGKDGKPEVSSADRGKRNRRKRHPGRPRASKDTKGKRWEVVLTMAERVLWKRLAKKAGMTPAQWLRIKLQTAS